MDYKKLHFDWKALVTIAVLLGMWYDLRTQFFVFKATTEVKIDNLERQLAQNTYRAIIPNEPKIEDERKR